MKNKLIYYLGLIVSLTFLYFVFRGINIHHLLGVLSSIKPAHALLVAVLSVFLIVFKTVRWKMFLDKIEKVSYKKLLSINMMSNMFNILLPLRAGEVFQIFMTKTETNANFERSKVAGTLVLNKVFELLSLLILCYVLTWFINLPAVWIIPIRILVFFMITFLLLFAFNVVNLKKISIPKNRFLKIAYNFLMSLKLIEDKLLLVKTLMLSLFIWGIELSMINILFTAFNLSFLGQYFRVN